MKGVEGQMLWIVIGAVLAIVTITIIILTSQGFLPGFTKGIEDVICNIPLLCR